MKAAITTSAGDFSVAELPDPRPGPDQLWCGLQRAACVDPTSRRNRSCHRERSWDTSSAERSWP